MEFNLVEIKKIIEEELKDALDELGVKNMEVELVSPPKMEMGDLAFPCFKLSKILKKSPKEIAEELVRRLESEVREPRFQESRFRKICREGEIPKSRLQGIEKVEAMDGYVNFFYDRDVFLENILNDVFKKGAKYGKSSKSKIQNTPLSLLERENTSPVPSSERRGRRIMVEYSSPNTNKPLHLGHGRNNFLGMAISNLLENAGEKVIRGMIINDRGIHICKSMVAYQEYGEGETPERLKMKGDHFVGKYYGMFGDKLKEDPSLEEKAKNMLRKWEAGDKEVMELWEKMNNWYYEGVNETYEKIGSKFDKEAVYYESKMYAHGKEIIMGALDKKIVYKKEDGAIAIDLTKEGLDEKIVLRSDGTSVYITQDLYTAVKRFEEFGLEKLIYVVGNEQNYHFDVLFKILNKLGYEWAGNNSQLFHLSYGMVNLPEGKLKSREGTKVDLDDLVDNLKNLAMAAIREKHGETQENKKAKKQENNKTLKQEIASEDMEKLSKVVLTKNSPCPPLGKGVTAPLLEERAMRIGLAALKFMLLRVNPSKDVSFNPKEAISFEGDTGPYILYAYARIKSILRKVDQTVDGKEALLYGKIPLSPLLKKGEKIVISDEEMKLVKMIYDFPEVLEKAAGENDPSRVANFILELAGAFNSFYHIHKVIDAETAELKEMRLSLIQAVSIVLKRGMEILGIETVDMM